MARVKNIMTIAKDKIILPVDILCANSFINENPIYKTIKDGLKDYVGLDIGYLTIDLFSKYIKNAQTIYFNGPVGVCEFGNFQIGTEKLIKNIELAKKENDACVFFAGGDTFAIVKNMKAENDAFSFFTTCGKNSNKLLDNELLKGLENINNK
jgi:phosphoglycerate kinase